METVPWIEISIAHLDYGGSDNSIMQLLYKVARIYVEQLAGEEAEKTKERKYTAGRVTTPIPDTPPINYLKSTQLNRTAYNNFSELCDYIKRFQSEKTGRISWVECFKQGHKEKKAVVLAFKTSESFRGYYNKRVKSFINSTMSSASVNTMTSASTNINTCETLQK